MNENDDDRDAPEAERFIPFFEVEYQGLPQNERYLAGFQDEDGERWGVLPLPRRIVERAVFLDNFFLPQVNIDGTVRVWLEDVPEELYSEMQSSGNALIMPLDTLIAERLDMNMDEPDYGEDGVIPAYEAMRERLRAALELVESEILRRKSQHPGSDQIN